MVRGLTTHLLFRALTFRATPLHKSGCERFAFASALWGLFEMLLRNRIAALLTSVGLIGLTISNFLSPATANVTAATAKTISIAISSGSALHLLTAEQHVAENAVSQKFNRGLTETQGQNPSQRLICRHVYHLSIADLGITCSPASATVAMASN